MDLKLLQTMQSDEEKKQYLRINGIDPSQLDFFLTTIQQDVGNTDIAEEETENSDNSSNE
jgi:ribulose bisphosphate carboxylase small subunit